MKFILLLLSVSIAMSSSALAVGEKSKQPPVGIKCENYSGKHVFDTEGQSHNNKHFMELATKETEKKVPEYERKTQESWVFSSQTITCKESLTEFNKMECETEMQFCPPEPTIRIPQK